MPYPTIEVMFFAYRLIGLIDMPGKVNEAKWTRAKQIAAKQGRPRDWALIVSIYKSLGGAFR